MAEQEPLFEHVLEISGQELRAVFDTLQEGVFDPGDLKVTPGATGVTVDVAEGKGMVEGDSIPEQRLYHIWNDASKGSDTFEGGGLAAADPSNPRLDQIVARVWDHEADASGQRKWRLEVVGGTATSGATLDNRSGAAALPASAVRLADVLVPAGATSLVAADIRDRRPWARGAYFHYTPTGTGFTVSVTWTSHALLHADVERRIECSGKPLRVRFQATCGQDATGDRQLLLQPRIDGASPEFRTMQYRGDAENVGALNCEWVLFPTAGSHLIAIYAQVNAGDVDVFFGQFTLDLDYEIEEDLRLSAENA